MCASRRMRSKPLLSCLRVTSMTANCRTKPSARLSSLLRNQSAAKPSARARSKKSWRKSPASRQRTCPRMMSKFSKISKSRSSAWSLVRIQPSKRFLLRSSCPVRVYVSLKSRLATISSRVQPALVKPKLQSSLLTRLVSS